MTALRSLAWTRLETILALDLYLALRGQSPGPDDKHPQVIALSRLLRALSIHPSDARTVSFRNPQSVSLKLLNFRWIDPSVDGGMRGASQQMVQVWEEFAHDAEVLRAAVIEVLSSVDEGAASPFRASDVEAISVVEGQVQLATHLRRERDQQIVLAKKRFVLTQTGKLACEVCEFDFAARYGIHGKGFIECHHVRPLADLDSETMTHLDDLALVCSNCHRMLHRNKDVLTLDELRQMLVGIDLGSGL
jgi:5-methylcytosine-specific restriction protein A